MKREQALAHEFVDYIPKKLEDGVVVYVSLTYATAVHRSCCGCGSEVVTPLSPTDSDPNVRRPTEDDRSAFTESGSSTACRFAPPPL